MKTIVIACGTGVATSTIVMEKVKELLAENQIEANLIQCSAGDLASHADEADLIIATMQLEDNYGVPLVFGMSFLTGMGVEETKDKILQVLS